MTKFEQAADLLLTARRQMRRIAALPPECRPTTVLEAYRCQDALYERLLAEGHGPRVGYKIACTNPSAQKLLNLDGPFFGRLLAGRVRNCPAVWDPREFFMRVIEAEFAFEMADTLPAGGAPYTREQVSRAIRCARPALEIVDSRYTDWTTIGALSLIADNACAGAWSYGEPCWNWREVDLAAQAVRLIVNGKLTREGSGAAVMGHPLNVMTWLVNTLAEYGLHLSAGDLVTTGITTEVYLAEPGDEIVAEFGPIGTARLNFTR